jgi:hypothetical protein
MTLQVQHFFVPYVAHFGKFYWGYSGFSFPETGKVVKRRIFMNSGSLIPEPPVCLEIF